MTQPTTTQPQMTLDTELIFRQLAQGDTQPHNYTATQLNSHTIKQAHN